MAAKDWRRGERFYFSQLRLSVRRGIVPSNWGPGGRNLTAPRDENKLMIFHTSYFLRIFKRLALISVLVKILFHQCHRYL